jgi:SAM-dependent methyltransferase
VPSKFYELLVRGNLQTSSSIVEKLSFLRECLFTAASNRAFRRRHPEFSVPPLYLLWDAQSYTSFERYKTSGEAAAAFYWDLLQRHLDSPGGSPLRICEWGCGPARIIRHFPAVVGETAVELFGTDYNKRSIAWCKGNIHGITFAVNGLAPPLSFDDGTFDFLYCRSGFTHLSEEMHFAWMAELARVVRSAGVIALSTQGQAHRTRLLAEEKERFDRGDLVVRRLAAEGKLLYSAFHGAEFVRRRLLAGFDILEHIEGDGTQDVWVVRNTAPKKAGPTTSTRTGSLTL